MTPLSDHRRAADPSPATSEGDSPPAEASGNVSGRVAPPAHLRPPPSRPQRTLRFRRRALGALALVLAAAVYLGSQRRPTGPAHGTTLSGGRAAATQQAGAQRAPGAPSLAAYSAAAPGDLRVGTFNIHGCKGTDGVRDLDRIAHTIAGLDFVGLNEVRGLALGANRNQAAELGDTLQLGWLFAPTERRWWCDEFGNGLLSRLPVRSWQRIPLARTWGKSFRNVVLARIEYDERLVNVVVAHVDRSDDREREEQLRVVGDCFLALAAPAILLGDLNTSADEAPLARLLTAPGVRDPVAETLGSRTPRRIDWLLTRGFVTVDAGIVANGASDHPHVWAALRLETEASAPGSVQAAAGPATRQR